MILFTSIKYKYLRTNVKSYEVNITTNFHNNKISKDGSQCISLSVVLIDYVFRTVKNCYYPQVFLEVSKDIIKKILTLRFWRNYEIYEEEKVLIKKL